MSSLETHQSPMQSLQTNQDLNTATDFMNSQILSNSSLDQSSNTSLFDNVQVNDLTQFQGPYPVQITEALCNTSKYEFTASLVEQFRQDEAHLDQLAKRQTENTVQNVSQLLTQQQNVQLLNPIAEQQLTLSGQQTIQNVHPSGTFVSVTQPMFTAPQENAQNHQGTILTNSAVQILQQAANQVSQAAEQKPVITQFLKAPILQPQQAAQPVQFTQPTASIMLPTVSTHQVLVPLSVSQSVRRKDVFAVPKSKPPARRIAPAPPPPTTSSVGKVSTTALLSHLLTKDKKSTSFAIAPQPPSGIGNTATAVLVPTSILKTEFSTNPTCVISNTGTTPTIYTISSSTMLTSAAAATTLTPTNSKFN
ncbi:uncharacterized protein LOC117102963 [Anneissia japonica]|uniref:uncharacterized protein LOC117102963 n=1 Tax=Anneissia japonica TaxID=1529436 RepID=UPI00142594CE|nr:uncharacterized protein LOC117102963 [Anneissia japonica]